MRWYPLEQNNIRRWKRLFSDLLSWKVYDKFLFSICIAKFPHPLRLGFFLSYSSSAFSGWAKGVSGIGIVWFAVSSCVDRIIAWLPSPDLSFRQSTCDDPSTVLEALKVLY
ncbi:hypothetical protein BJX99DRAFT_80266 [Aspergillus californicus]